MTQNTYEHLFTGTSIDVLAVRAALSEVDIYPIVKDEGESARLAGFGVTAPLMQHMFVHDDEFEKATNIIDTLF